MPIYRGRASVGQRLNTYGLVLNCSESGAARWSLYAPEATDEAIQAGEALPLLSGGAAVEAGGVWSRPNQQDYIKAFGIHNSRTAGLNLARS